MEKAAVILAGGRSERFQRREEPWVDKALIVVHGITILESMIVQLRNCVDEIIISVSSEESKRSYIQALPPRTVRGVRILVDDVVSGGPLAGIATSVKHIDAKQFLFLPCDIPFLKPAVVKTLFERIGASDASVPVWPGGVLEPLMAAYRGTRVRTCCPLLLSAGRKRPSDLTRASSHLTFVSITKDLSRLDPEYKSFVNVNYRADMSRRSRASLPRGSLNRTFTVSISPVTDSDLRTISRAARALELHEDRWWNVVSPVMNHLQEREGFFWLAFLAESAAKSLSPQRSSQPKDQQELFETAARAYHSEAELYMSHGLLAIRAHALLDEAWCWRNTHREDRSRCAFQAAASTYAKLGLDIRKSRTLSTQKLADTSRWPAVTGR